VRKRSRYKPKPVVANPLALMQPASTSRRDAVLLHFYTALEAMSRGDHPGESEWRTLSDAINSIETLALHMRKLVPAEVMPAVNSAIAAMVGAANRFKAGQGMRLDGAGLAALREVVGIYEQCLDGFTEHEMARAQAETQRRMSALLRSPVHSKEVVTL